MNNRDASIPFDGVARSQPYLEATVSAASPARLRLMLIERAIGVAGHLARTWRSKQALGPNEYSIKLLDIVNELLSGVVGGATEGENEVCHKVADLYVFLAKHLVQAERTSDSDAIEEIKTVLEVEAETWRAVCALGLPTQGSTIPGTASLNLEA